MVNARPTDQPGGVKLPITIFVISEFIHHHDSPLTIILFVKISQVWTLQLS